MTTLAGVWVQLQGDWSRLRAESAVEGARAGRIAADAFKAEWDRADTTPKIRPTLDITLFRQQWNAFQLAYLRNQTINVTPVLTGGIGQFSTADRTLKVSPRLDITIFRQQWRLFEAVYLHPIHIINVHPHLTQSAVTVMTRALNDSSERAGKSAGGKFFDSFTNRFALIAGAVAGALPLIQPVLQVLGDIVQAAGAVGAAIPAALAAGGLAVGALVAAFHNLGDAIKGQFSGDPTKGQQEAFDKLSRSAKTFVGLLLEMRTGLKGAQTAIQESFFRPFNEGFKQLIGSGLFQQVRAALAAVAADAGAAGAAIAKTVAGSARSGQVGDILKGSRETLSFILAALPKAATLFLTLAQAAQPFVNLIVSQVAESFGDLVDKITKAQADGRLAKFFSEGATQLFALVHLLENVGSIFKTVFDAFNGGADGMLGSLSVLTGQVAAFLKSAQGQEILKLFADKLSLIGQVITTVLGPVLPIIIELAKTISGALNGAIQQLLPAVGNLLSAMADGLKPILEALAPIFDKLVTTLADFLVLAIREVTKHINELMPVLLDIIREVAPYLPQMFEALFDVMVALLPLIPTFTQLMKDILPVVIALLPVLEFFIQASAKLTEEFALIIEWTVKVIAWMGNLNQAITKLPIALQETGDFFVRIWGYITDWFTGTIVPSLQKAISDIAGFFRGLGQVAADVWHGIVSSVSGAWNAIRDNVFSPMINFVTQDLPAAWRRGVDLIGFWWDALRELAAKPVRFFIDTVVNKGVIGTFNTVAGFFGAPTVKTIPVPFATGGPVSGPGGPRDDVIPAWLSNGEYVVPANVVARMGVPYFDRLIGRTKADRPGDGSQGLAFADGGLVGLLTDPVQWIKDKVPVGSIPGEGSNWKPVLVGAGGKLVSGLIDWAQAKIASFLGGTSGFLGPITGSAAGIASWLFAQNGKPYGWAQAGPGFYDCSGIVSAVWNLMHGANPYRHTFSTSGQSLFFPKRNQYGVLTAGWANPGERGGGSVGHTAANFAGIGLESTGSRGVRIGAGTTPVTSFAHWGTFADGGLVAKLFDRGGLWPSGTLGANLSGGTEVVTPAPTMDQAVELLRRIAELLAAMPLMLGRELTGASAESIRIGRARVGMV